MEPRFNDLWYNDIPGLAINIPLPSKNHSNPGIVKCMGQNIGITIFGITWYNDIPVLTMGMSLTERKIFPVITIKSISQTTGNVNIVNVA